MRFCSESGIFKGSFTLRSLSLSGIQRRQLVPVVEKRCSRNRLFLAEKIMYNTGWYTVQATITLSYTYTFSDFARDDTISRRGQTDGSLVEIRVTWGSIGKRRRGMGKRKQIHTL